MTDVYQWRRTLHIPFIIILQILFIILFAIFVRYDPQEALGSPEDPPLIERFRATTSHSIDTPSTSKSSLTTADNSSPNPEPPTPSPEESEKSISELDTTYEFEKNLVAAIQEINEPNNPSNSKIHEKVKSLQDTIMRFINDRTNADHESAQEHGIHQQAVQLISHVYPCIKSFYIFTYF